MREIVLDTETTGLDPNDGHRLVEIGCVELENHIATGESFHVYINPERDMPTAAFNVHGLSEEFLSDKPRFAEIADGFLAFIGDSPLVIHNASFDMAFLNAELTRLKHPELPMTRAVDTISMARRKFPGAQANLDALCRRFGIDNSNRVKHGALLDAELLAEVYLELIGGRQPGLSLSLTPGPAVAVAETKRIRREPRPYAPSAEEIAAHDAFLESLKSPIWRQ